MTRPFKPKNTSSLIPYLTVPNAAEAITFYQKSFQFELLNSLKKEEHVIHAHMALGDAQIMFAPEGEWGADRKAPSHSKHPSPIGLYVYVADVDAFAKHAQQFNAELLDAPADTFWGDRMCRLKDPFGYEWSFATNVKDFDPTKTPF